MKRFLLAGGFCWTALGAWAHGGLSMEQDMCKLTVGPYMMHFAGYQEDAQRTEFCEDIPHKGPTIIVLDMVDASLRDMPVEFRIVRKTDGPLEAAPVVYQLPAATYPRGTLMVRHDFMDDGDYVGLVYAGDKQQHSSVFPFAVGKPRGNMLHYVLGAAGLLLLGFGGLALGRQRLQRDIAQQADKQVQ
ncbi:MAG: hypothetical protein RI998_915 [Pseudomonadota bacterium]|jgi:hypothetical protein